MHKIDPALLGFDFDGVIADTAENFLRLACQDYGFCDRDKEEITDFEVEQCLGLEPETVNSIFTAILKDSIATGLQPMPGAIKVLSELAAKTEVTVITARPLAEPVHDWLQSMFARPLLSSIRVVAMGDHDDKARHIAALGLDYFIDDRVETCIQLSETEIQPIVFHQPWNRNRHQLPMVHSWQEIKELCL